MHKINNIICLVVCMLFFFHNSYTQSYNLKKESDFFILSKGKGIQNATIKAEDADSILFINATNRNDFSVEKLESVQDTSAHADQRIVNPHQRFIVKYKDVKVENVGYAIHYRDTAITSINGIVLEKDVFLDVNPTITTELAIEKAKQFIGARKYIWEADKSNESLKDVSKKDLNPTAELIICKTDLNKEDSSYHLAYKIKISALDPVSSDYVYVDAKTGEILQKKSLIRHSQSQGNADTRYSGYQPIMTELESGEYNLIDNSRYDGIITQDCASSCPVPIDDDNEWSAAEFPGKANAVLDAHWGMGKTLDYFTDVFGRESFDNNGSAIAIRLSDDPSWGGPDNAGWYGTGDPDVVFGRGDTLYDALTSLDIVAHEFSHGICQVETVLLYEKESGAISESLSDIWAACVEYYYDGLGKDYWSIGESIELRPGHTVTRSFRDPHSEGQPDTYGANDAYWFDCSNCTPTSNNDLCGIHTNSGVMNHWFYLLAAGNYTGETQNENAQTFDITGIGIETAAKIVYLAEAGGYLDYNADMTFSEAREATIQAASDYYGEDCEAVATVTNAWYAVGVGAASPVEMGTSSYSGNISTTVKHSGIGYIVSTNNILNGANVTFNSADEVRLQTDFTANAGSIVHVYITECAQFETPYYLRSASIIGQPKAEKENEEEFDTLSNSTNSITVSPNPSNDGHFTVSTNLGTVKSAKAVAYDLSGKVLANTMVEEGKLNLSALANGMYVLSINNESINMVSKVIINRK